MIDLLFVLVGGLLVAKLGRYQKRQAEREHNLRRWQDDFDAELKRNPHGIYKVQSVYGQLVTDYRGFYGNIPIA